MVSPGMTYVGRISYSLYLWHWPVFSLFRWTVGMSGPLTASIALALAFALSALSYHLLERPFHQSRSLRNQPSWKIATAGVASIAVCSLATGLLFLLRNDASLGLNLSVTSNTCDWNPYQVTGCAKDSTAVKASSPSGKKIIVIGDSHARAYTSMVTHAATALGAEATVHARPGCPIARLIHASHNTQLCRDFEESILAWVKQHTKPGDIVFLASLRVHRLGDQRGLFDQDEVLSRGATAADTEERKLALKQATNLVGKFQALGLYVLMDAPKPIFKAPPFRCSDWFNKTNPVCAPGFTISRDLLLKHREPTMDSLRKLETSNGVYVWDPFPILCGGPVCSAFEEDRPVFSDGDHLSGHGNRLLLPSFTRQLREIWNRDAKASRSG